MDTNEEVGVLATVTVLEREMYEVGEAARLLGLHARTLRNWLDGYSARGKLYRPVLREEPTGSDLLTWGEFIEAGHLTAYRREQRVPLPELRAYIDSWREKLGIPYPLAHQQPYVAPGPGLMDMAEHDDGVRVMYRFSDGQTTLMPWAEEFVHKVEFDGNIAQRYWPSGRDQRVVIDPDRSFGAPIVEGIRTEVLFEMFLAGDPVDEIAESYDLKNAVVEAAIRFESPRPRQPAEATAA